MQEHVLMFNLRQKERISAIKSVRFLTKLSILESCENESTGQALLLHLNINYPGSSPQRNGVSPFLPDYLHCHFFQYQMKQKIGAHSKWVLYLMSYLNQTC